eukprot:TRINITY_DN16723_c0_g1_i1.p1 TRINITY_DN16723_c0_g1~~TRINITY_DN16723_c0_g1_i1.p1  ORF type:complete len:441 (-),score=64.93 TRINITY_DN16723_c0_g1_i1:12-1334(-)
MASLTTYTVAEVATHDKRSDCWVIIDGNVYDLTHWAPKHPGGPSIIFDYAGQDATDAVHAMHPALGLIQYELMRQYKIGAVSDYQPSEIQSDFREMRHSFLSEGLFESSPWFYTLNMIQIVVCEVIAHYIVLSWGLSTWWNWIACAFFLVVSQAQAGWIQHDFGHLSILNQRKKNRPFWMTNQFWHYVTISGLKGASSSWWRYRHNRHHCKPNILKKDPDLANEPLFIFHENMVDLGMASKGTPYQAKYWWIIGPPLITSVLFFLTNIYFVFSRKLYKDFLWGISYITRTIILAKVGTGSWGAAVGFYFFMRCFESMWFSWVVSMNHFPMHMNLDRKDDWVTSQLRSTQNVNPSYFNNWFTGHLNYQIEHHLFPTMPRHNYHKISDRVQALCKKHGLVYTSKGLLEAFADVVRALDRTALYNEEKKKEKQKLKNEKQKMN